MRILLLTPPLTQLNTPYPATVYLTGFLRSRGYDAEQADLGIETALTVFSRMVAQAARVTHALTRAGIMVHAYLMYGFPSETPRETIETLERVRQFFAAGLIQSAYWHRFTATVHSPVGLDPAAYGIALAPPPSGAFARNDLVHRDPVGGDPSAFGPGLARAVYHYMHGVGLDRDIRTWFDGRQPTPRVSPTLIRDVLREATNEETDNPLRHEARLVWLGGRPRVDHPSGSRGSWRVALPGREGPVSVAVSRPVAEWLADLIEAATPRSRHGAPYPALGEAAASYPGRELCEAWRRGRVWARVRRAGLLIL